MTISLQILINISEPLTIDKTVLFSKKKKNVDNFSENRTNKQKVYLDRRYKGQY